MMLSAEFMPQPQMGGLVQVMYDEWAAWMCGKPKANRLDSCDDNASALHEQGMQIHTIKDSMRFEEQMKGLDTKFTKDRDWY